VDRVRVSKRLAYVLRHRPDSIGISLDDAGWVDIDVLVAALRSHGAAVRRRDLEQLVDRDEKGRYLLDETNNRIRANQGHSLQVNLGYPAMDPPPQLYHGTAARNIPAILAEGLHRGARHDVHLSPDAETAAVVGARRGRHVVLAVDAARLAADGATFRCSANGVWLVDSVPPGYLRRY
jgi:putative RNA 2'-phosphotransferase